jgi:hypothetical protein
MIHEHYGPNTFGASLMGIYQNFLNSEGPSDHNRGSGVEMNE